MNSSSPAESRGRPAPETVYVDTARVACDGGGAPAHSLGHPRVFLTLTAAGSVDCPYCDRHFVLKAGAKGSAH